LSKNKSSSKRKAARPVASKIKAKGKARAVARPVASRKTPARAKTAAVKKPAIGKKSVSRKNVVKTPVIFSARKQSIKMVSPSKSATPEQKAEIEHIHRILSDAYVRQMLIEIGGENALEIVRHFYGNHSDEELAKSLQLRISDVRATLNRLHSKGLVQYAREKDSETGWYSYSWSLNKGRIVKWVSETAGKVASSSAGGDGNQYYFCPACGLGSIVDFGVATDSEFRCGKCNKSLEFIEEERFSVINQFLKK
jgi:transcription initiation factor TFIIE subunit alpha